MIQFCSFGSEQTSRWLPSCWNCQSKQKI